MITTDGSEAFYVLVADLAPKSFNVFPGDILGTATPLSNAVRVDQIQELEESHGHWG